MTDSMSKVLVVGPEARDGDHLPGSRIYFFTGDPGPRGFEGRFLIPVFYLPYLALAIGGFAKHRRSGYIRFVTLNAAAHIDQDHVAFMQYLWRYRFVRRSSVLSQ